MQETANRPVSLIFKLFGGFVIVQNGQPISGLHLRQGERLLAYLVLHASRWVDKRELAKCFWGEREVDDPDQNLRQSLSFLRQVLGVDAECLETRTGAVRLMLDTVQADTLQFEEACNRGDSASLVQAERIAEELLLAGWSDPWITPFRERYQKKLQQAQARLRSQDPRHNTAPERARPRGADSVRPAGGIVPTTSTLYIARASDQALYSALQSSEGIILLKGSRQVGKSSLLARGLAYARSRNATVYHTNFDELAPADLHDRDTLYLRLIASLAEQADHEVVPERDWKPYRGAIWNLERFVREYVLKATGSPVVWALDGIDCLFKTAFYNEFFAFLRGIHSKRATQPTVPWERFTLLLAAATEAHLYIPDLNQSPFNVGTRIELADFTESEQKELISRCDLPHDPMSWQRLTDLVGGHPYLLTRALQEIQSKELTVEEFTAQALQPGSPYHDHLERMRRWLLADSELHTAIKAILTGQLCTDSAFFRLRSAGVISGPSPDAAVLRCGLYQKYFAKHLLA